MSFYNSFFNFIEEPFKLTPDPSYFYLSTSHEEAIQLIEYAIQSRKGFMALIGEVGTGKTTLVRVLLEKLTNVETSLVLNPFLNADEILRYVCKDFGLDVDDEFDKGKIYEKLTDFLLSLYEKGKNALIIIDESQNLSLESMEMLRQLSNIEKEDCKLLQIIFVGQPEFLEKLESNEYRQLKQRISLVINLKQLDKEDTANYIRYRIQKASKYYKKIFTDDAIQLIYTFSKGNPREINKICEYSLIAAFNDKSKKVTKKHVEKALKELKPILLNKGSEKKDKKFVGSIILIIFVLAGFLFFFSLFSKKEIESSTVSEIRKETIPAVNENKKELKPVSTDKSESKKEKVATKQKDCIRFKVHQNIRQNPNSKSKILYVAQPKDTAKIIEKKGKWAKISIDNQIGWILLYNRYNFITNCVE